MFRLRNGSSENYAGALIVFGEIGADLKLRLNIRSAWSPSSASSFVILPLLGLNIQSA